jgi:hypothetical protein
MILRVEIDYVDFRRVYQDLQRAEPEMTKQMVRDFKEEVKPFAQKVARGVPHSAPLSGMDHKGRTRWAKVNGTSTFKPSGGRGRVAFGLKFSSQGAGYALAELAGTRSNGRTPQGQAFIRNLAIRNPLLYGKYGRFLFRAYLPHKQEMIRLADNVLNKFVARFNGKRL